MRSKRREVKGKKEISINLGPWTEASLEGLLRASSGIRDTGDRIVSLSRPFIGTPYRESTLTGSASEPEVLTIDLAGVDCFTFIDYIEALRRARSFEEFTAMVREVRYRSGIVAYSNRNHFFTDWSVFNAGSVSDVTGVIGGEKARSVRKCLNRKEDGTSFLPGMPPVERDITYLPSGHVDKAVLDALRNGDYIGIYSPQPGLDVSHVGILVREDTSLLLRHASSAQTNRKVVDQEFSGYIAGKPGIVVLRPK
ncbi:MAG: N-acetylmuramoyl-L-alanine amidase-like domain-containing protein [Nitrospirota bacterium]